MEEEGIVLETKRKKKQTVMPFSVYTERACGKTVPFFPTIFSFSQKVD